MLSGFVRCSGALLLLLICAPGQGQQPSISVRADLSPAQLSVGQEGSYTILVDGAGTADRFPKEIKVAGLNVIFKKKGRRFKIVNGRSVQRFQMSYSVSAQSEGKFVIPAQSIGIGKGNYKTNVVNLTVKSAAPTDQIQKPKLSIEIGKKEVFVGEVIPIALVVEVPAGSQFRPSEHPKFNPEGFAVKRFAVPTPGRHRNGWGEYRYESSLSAITLGNQTLVPAELAFSVGTPPQRSSRTPFTRGWATKNYRMKTEPVPISVKALPKEGMPTIFEGSVGKFTLSVSASPRELRVNDPLVIDAKITGTGNFDRLTAPVLTDVDGWKLQKPGKYMENRSNGLQRGTTAFSQVVQPLRIFTELPPLEFCYFDTEAGKYHTLRSDPIAITVLPNEDSSGRVSGKDFTTPEASVPAEELGDILTIFQQPGDLRRVDGSDAPGPIVFRMIVVITLLAVIGIVAFGWGRFVKERRHARAHEGERRQHRPSGDVMVHLSGGGNPAKRFYALASEYMDALAAERGHSVGDAVRDSKELREVHAQAQYYLYGSSAGKAAEAVNTSEQDRVIELMKRLDIETRESVS